MRRTEHYVDHDQEEHLDPRHFYAAYVFCDAHKRQGDVAVVIAQAQQLGYPVRYWWLSQAVHLDGAQDRLIVCVHHASSSGDAGMDLYDALTEQETEWDFLEAAAVMEYGVFGTLLEGIEAIEGPDGTLLFPPGTSNEV